MSDYDTETDRQYSCSLWCINKNPVDVIQYHLNIVGTRSAVVRKMNDYKQYCYKECGATEENQYEIYRSIHSGSNALMIYIHGGFWHQLDLKSSSFLADWALPNGINFVAIGYNLTPSVSLETIVMEVRTSLKAILTRHTEFDRVFICGHSAGAHLALMSLVFDGFEYCLSFSDQERQRISGLILLSGIYDVRPVCRIKDNEYIRLNHQTAWQLSPLRCIDNLQSYNAPFKVYIIVAEHDSPAFINDSRSIFSAMQNVMERNLVMFYLAEGRDHFEVVQDIGNPNYQLNDLLITFMKQ